MIRRDIAMVLSGGGARGMAHVGVLRAFEEASIPIDVIGGTSFGAIIAVLRAMDHSWREIRDILWDNLASVGAPIDVTPPALAISKGQRLIRLLGSTIGDAHLEDVWLRCFCVSSNLSSGHPLVHTSGSAATALRASVAIPGVFPPVASGDGEVLVDGAVMNNLPVDVMAGFSSGGPIIAVNLRAPAQLTAGELPEDGVVSGWRMLGRRLNPLQQKVRVPSLVEILTRASEVGGAEAARALEQSADFVLHPPTGDHALLDFSALDDLITSGYEHTVAQLEAWQEAGRPLTAR
jgi:predicted acylesterase/phospholipase RssA